MHRGILTILTAGLLYIAGSGVAWSATYYIAASGSDSNNGTSKSTPWLHAPGMPKCSGSCASHTPTAGDHFIFRGGDTWHFGNSSLSPYTGGIWSFPWGDYANCNYGAAQTGCIYFGVDQTWFSGGSWQRPILNGDNPLSNSRVSSCSYRVGTDNQLVIVGPGTIFDNFEMLGLCTSDASPGNAQDTYITYYGTGNGGTGTAFINNVYAHGWTASTGAGGGTTLACVVIGGGSNGLQSIDHVVIDGSDSDPEVCAWGTFPSFYHFRDSMIRYTTQGVGQWCHDIHDNIFEFFSNPDVPTHGNILECNDDSNGTAAYQPQNTPNVFYNNIVRHATTGFSTAGQVTLWFCPESVPEYWFNNLVYDVGNSNYWDIAGPPIYGCTNTGKQYMFNNTLVDGRQPCYNSTTNIGGQYLYVSNELLINSPWGQGTGNACNGVNDPSNIAMSDATAITQGYGSNSGKINTQNNSINCANDGTTPCSPTSFANSGVGKGTNQQAYCSQLASYTSELAISTDAANACKYGTTDGCAYNSSTHTMVCPARTAVARPASGAWDVGAYQFSGTSAGTSLCMATKKNADYSADNGSATTASVTANINAVGDLVAITAWCYPACSPVSVTLGSQPAVQTSVSGINGSGSPGTGQGFIFYILSASASGSQTLTFTASGSHTDIQTSYIDFSPSAGCTFTHDVDSSVGTGTGGTANTPSITPTPGDLLFNFTYSSEHINSVNSPWSCPIYSGLGETQTCEFVNTINAAAYILGAASGSTVNNMTLIHNTDSWQALITSFAMSNNAQAPPPNNPPTSLTVVVH
jgi:hypothetical protein